MDVLAWIVAVGMVIVGLLGIFLPLLPGVPLLFGGLWLAAWLDGYRHVSGFTIWLLAGLSLVAWLADYLASAWVVKRSGASTRATIGAGVGSVLGMFGGLVGLIVGPVVGALLGERSAGRDWRQAGTAAVAAGGGLLVAALVKLLLALCMLVVFAVAWWV